MSTNGSSVCEDGIVDDNFLVYITIPCTLDLNVHFGLSILWVVCFGLLLLELLVSRLLGHFSEFHKAKRGTGSVLVKDAAYLSYLAGGLIIFIIVVCDPQASVQDSIGSGLWFGISLSLSGLVALPAAMAVFNTQPLLITIGIHSSTFKSADFNTRVFQIVKYAQYVVFISFLVIALVTLVILTNTFINFDDRQRAVDACFAAFGIFFALTLTSVMVTSESIIKVVDARIQFERDLPAHNQAVPTLLSLARKRLRAITIIAFVFGLFFCVIHILIGTNVIPLHWIAGHVLFGFLPVISSLGYRLVMKDSILEARCLLPQVVSPHQSSKDRDASDHDSSGKVAAIEKAQANSHNSMEQSSSPSEMLAKLDMSSFATPAHALLTMQEEQST